MELFFNIIYIINNLIFINYIESIFIYLIFLIIFFSFSLPGSTIFIFASGYFFGFYLGYIINIIAVSIGSVIFISYSKTIFKIFFNNYFEKYSFKFNDIIKNSSYEYLILLRLIIGPPILIQNICLSFLKISKFKLFLTTFIGFSPIFLLISYIGEKLSSVQELKKIKLENILSLEYLIIIFLIILLLISRIITKKK